MLIIYGLMIGWLKSKLIQSAQGQTKINSVSVIVPFRNEEASLPTLLKCLPVQVYNGSWEVVLVNDHSDDNSVPLILDFIKENKLSNFRLIHSPEEHEGKKKAIAFGIENAVGEIIVQTDADCHMENGWLQNLISGFDKNAHMVLGPVAMIPKKSFWSKFAALEFLSLQASGAGFALGQKPIMGSAANMAYRKSILAQFKFSGSELSSGDDVFMIQSLAKENPENVKFILNRAAQTYTDAPGTFGEFINQRARWGSKTTAYPSKFAIAVAILIGGLSVILCLLAFLSFWQTLFLEVFVVALFMKAAEDYFFLRKYARLTQQVSLLKIFIPSVLIYPFYICITGIAMLFKTSWKGRAIKK